MVKAYMHQYTDLIEKCIACDQKSQRELYDLLKGKLMGICYRYNHLQEDANDVFQDVVISLFKNLEQVLLVDNFDGWVRRIAVNAAIDAFRKRKSKEVLSLEEGNVIEFSSGDINAFEALKAEEILGLIKRLPHSQMMVFNLYSIDGYSHKEIAEQLEVAESTSRVLLTRARKNIIALLRKIEANEGICR